MSAKLDKTGEFEQLAMQAGFKPDNMAALYGCSRRQLERIFSEQLRTTPGSWLRELQCRLAKDMVAKGHKNKEIADELKFANESHFCREFRKKYGDTPKAYARSLKSAQNVAIRQ
jgi:AraC-like DNA-binding protein